MKAHLVAVCIALAAIAGCKSTRAGHAATPTEPPPAAAMAAATSNTSNLAPTAPR
jgi:hypothetical protein